MTTETIATSASSTWAGCRFDHINAQWYHSRVSSKKGLIGFGDSIDPAAQSRHTAKSCGFFVRAPVLAARMGGRKACRFTASAGSPVRQPVRAASLFGDGEAVIQLTHWRPIMALSPAIGAHPLAVSDLIIDIRPRFICRYYGTSAQLVAEGLIPSGLQWPSRRDRARFSDDRFDYWLERRRAPGTKGPVKDWIDGDYWTLDSTPKGPRISWVEHQIVEKQRELAELNQFNSPARQLRVNRAVAAKLDSAYQGFLTRALGDMAPRKRGRPAKTTNPTKSQGATA